MRPVDKHAQYLEQIGFPLDLIDDDEPAQIHQRELRVCEPGLIDRIFQIKKVGGASASDLPCQRRLAALARADQRNDGAVAQCRLDGCLDRRSRDHGAEHNPRKS